MRHGRAAALIRPLDRFACGLCSPRNEREIARSIQEPQARRHSLCAGDTSSSVCVQVSRFGFPIRAGSQDEGTAMSGNFRCELLRPKAGIHTKPLPRRVFISAGLVVLALVAASPALARSNARSNFDGDWSVVIETRSGACIPTIRYPVAITNGIVTNGDDTAATVQGQVAPSGAVRVTVQAGGSWANGSGRLTASGGSGLWQGQGTSGLCEGTWQAERRSYGAQATRGGAPIYNYAPRPPRQYYPAYPAYPSR